MNSVPFLLVILLHQNLQQVQSVHDDEVQNLFDTVSTLNELQKHIEIKLDSVIALKTDLSNGIYDSSSLLVVEALDELTAFLDNSPNDEQIEANEELATKIKECSYEVLSTLDLATKRFAGIEVKINTVLDAIKKVENDSGPEQLIEQLKEQYESILASDIEEFLSDLKRDSESVPLNVKTCVESASELAPLILSPDRRFSELLSENEKQWLNLVDEKTELVNKMHEECSTYILAGMAKAQQVSSGDVQSEKFKETIDKIFKCGIENDLIIDAANTKFYELEDGTRQDLSVFAKDNYIKIKGRTLDVVSDQSDGIMGDYKEIFDSTNQNLRTFLEEFKQQSISAPVNVKTCIEEAVDPSKSSSLKTEL